MREERGIPPVMYLVAIVIGFVVGKSIKGDGFSLDFSWAIPIIMDRMFAPAIGITIILGAIIITYWIPKFKRFMLWSM